MLSTLDLYTILTQRHSVTHFDPVVWTTYIQQIHYPGDYGLRVLPSLISPLVHPLGREQEHFVQHHPTMSSSNVPCLVPYTSIVQNFSINFIFFMLKPFKSTLPNRNTCW